MRMYLTLWEGVFGKRVYVRRALYTGLYFYVKGGRLLWNSHHRERMRGNKGDEAEFAFWTDPQLKKEACLMTDLAESLGLKLGELITPEQQSELFQKGFANASVYSGRHLHGELMRQNAPVDTGAPIRQTAGKP